MRSLPILAFAGLSSSALAATVPYSLYIHADATAYTVGDTITWTVSVTGLSSLSEYLSGYDLNFIASNDLLGTATGFVDNLSPFLAPTPGAASGASLLGASGGQSSIIGGVQQGDIVLGTFQVVTSAEGVLSYTIADGGVINDATIDHLAIYHGTASPSRTTGVPEFFFADEVRINFPSPGGVVALAPLALLRRRRR